MIDYKIIMNKTNGECGVATFLAPITIKEIKVEPNLEYCWSIAYSPKIYEEPLMVLIESDQDDLAAMHIDTFRKHFEVIGDL